MLATRGAVLIDADAIARELQAPDGALFEPMVDRFGQGVVAADGTLDRAAIAAIVFHDKEALADLNKMTWPAIGMEMARRRAEQDETDNIVILDIPLLAQGQDRPDLAGIVVVDCPVETQVARLVGPRGMPEADARARIANQSTREERLERADFVIDNSGDLAHLESEVDRCWAWLQDLQAMATRHA